MSLRIIILSNHHFALPTIELLLGYQVVAGIITPKLSHDANQQAGELAQAHQVDCLQVEQHELEEVLGRWIDEKAASAVFVLSFPWRIPESVLEKPPYGFVNFHPGKLPEHRGPDPIFWQIVERKREIILTAHLMAKGFDTGDIIHSIKQEIPSISPYGLVTGQLAKKAAELAKTLAEHMLSGQAFPRTAQDKTKAAYQKRPQLADFVIRWEQQNAREIEALVSACNPQQQGAMTFCQDQMLRILQVSHIYGEIPDNCEPGTIVETSEDTGLQVYCHEGGTLRLDIIALQDGFMTGDRFAKLIRLQKGDCFQTLPPQS